MGKEGGSGGWSHLHFEVFCRQPSGKWGTQEAYAFVWEAYRREHHPKLIAVARPHHLVWAGETVTLDATRSWSADGKIARYEWTFTDGTTAEGRNGRADVRQAGLLQRGARSRPTRAGDVDYDFAIVDVMDPQQARAAMPPTIHAAYYPTFGIQPGDEVTFKVRTFGTTDGEETWDFGDGSPTVHDQVRRQRRPPGQERLRGRHAPLREAGPIPGPRRADGQPRPPGRRARAGLRRRAVRVAIAGSQRLPGISCHLSGGC